MTIATDKNVMTNSVTKSIDIERPITQVYNQWTQFESFPQFMHSVESIEQVDSNHMHWRTSIAGVKREFDAEITEQTPNERIAWRSTDGETHVGVASFQKIDENSTRLEIVLDWKAEGATEKIGAALQLDDVSVQQDLKNFKELIENDKFSEKDVW